MYFSVFSFKSINHYTHFYHLCNRSSQKYKDEKSFYFEPGHSHRTLKVSYKASVTPTLHSWFHRLLPGFVMFQMFLHLLLSVSIPHSAVTHSALASIRYVSLLTKSTFFWGLPNQSTHHSGIFNTTEGGSLLYEDILLVLLFLASC